MKPTTLDSPLTIWPATAREQGRAPAHQRAIVRLNHLILILLFGLLATMIVLSPSELRYDESAHLQGVLRIRENGWQQALASTENPSAVGPLYPAVHILAAPLTGSRAPAIRWINFACLFLTIVLLTASFQRTNEVRAPFLQATSLLAVPFLWPASGLALTELPALLPFTLFVIVLLTALRAPSSSTRQLVAWGALAGAFLGVAILGRQTYLITLGALALHGCFHRRYWPLTAACAVVSLLASGWLFILWNGYFVPPSHHYQENGLRLGHGMYSLSYLGIAALFLAPTWLRPRGSVRWLVPMVLGTAAAWLTRHFADPPAKALLTILLGDAAAQTVGFLIGVGMCMVGMLWFMRLIEQGWTERREPGTVFLILVLLALAAAPVMISHQFSSRYVVGALTVQWLVLADWQAINPWTMGLMSVGAALGAALLGPTTGDTIAELMLPILAAGERQIWRVAW